MLLPVIPYSINTIPVIIKVMVFNILKDPGLSKAIITDARPIIIPRTLNVTFKAPSFSDFIIYT